MEKTARTPSADPAQEKLRTDKAAWNKEVSAFINDLIHLKKMMNGWPSKFFKERTRITEPIPADPATIIGSLAGDFQEITNRGNAIIQEQVNYAKTRRRKQPKSPEGAPAPTPTPTPAAQPAPAGPPAVDLNKQLAAWENKYQLVAEGSNPISRFVTKILTPTIGFGEAARIRRLRMTLLDSCVKTNSDLKKLHKEIVKSSSSSIVNAHKLMQSTWNHWAIVARTFSTFKSMKTTPIAETGGQIEMPEEIEAKKRKEEEGAGLESNVSPPPALPKSPPTFETPTVKKQNKVPLPPLGLGNDVINHNLPTEDLKTEAQLAKWLGKARHQILPGATSGSRLEVYRLIAYVRKDLNDVMDLLQSGFDENLLTQAIIKVNRQMISLRAMVRLLHYSEKPEEIPPTSFF